RKVLVLTTRCRFYGNFIFPKPSVKDESESWVCLTNFLKCQSLSEYFMIKD
ncbi:hypothetical protein LINPERHAP2_LOCUS39949, partial [Linum perenne]